VRLNPSQPSHPIPPPLSRPPQRETTLQAARVAAAIRATMCVKSATGAKYVEQKWYECVTCNLTKATGLGVCESCQVRTHFSTELSGGCLFCKLAKYCFDSTASDGADKRLKSPREENYILMSDS
jgi:hypothetical protein